MRFWIPGGYKSNFRDFIIDCVTYDILVYIDIYDGYDRIDNYKFYFRLQLSGSAYQQCKNDGYNPDEEIIHNLLNSEQMHNLVYDIREDICEEFDLDDEDDLYGLDIRVSGYIPIDGKEVEGRFI